MNGTNANKSGVKLETKVSSLLSDNNIPVYEYKSLYTSDTTLPIYAVSQYKHLDIFNANARIDFLIVNNNSNKKFYLECKNQAVPGSVDQKFPYYIHNILNNKYDGELVFLLNLSGIRQNVLNWLIENAVTYNYYLVSIDSMDRVLDIVNSSTNERIFLGEATQKSNHRNLPMSPPIKWAGGKRMIMNHILEYIPKDFNNYFEPFLGGSSVLLELFNKGILNKTKNIYVSDINKPLINMYQVIKNFPNELITELQKDTYNSKEHYYTNRDLFNKLKKEFDYTTCSIELAALFIYLNKYGFNGMYRENRSGHFNVPVGSQLKPSLIDSDNILMVSNCFKENNVQIISCSYDSIFSYVSEKDFVYLDPPYDETFTDYTKEPFGKEQQHYLKSFVTELTKKKAYVMMSNSNTSFINELYSGIPFKQYLVDTKRLLNSNANNRKNVVQETITLNY